MLVTKKLRALAAALFIAATQTAFFAPVAALAQTPAATPAPAATASVPPAAAPSTALSETPDTEKVANPYGLDSLWRNGDFVARTTLIILVIMSMGSWYIMVTKFFEQFKLNGQGRDADKKFWNASSVQAGAEELKADSPFRFLAGSALQATERHEGLRGGIDLNEWVTMSIMRAQENIGNRPARWPGVPSHGWLDSAVRWPVRYGLGDLSRVDGHRYCRTSVDRQGRRTGWRSADHDRVRSGSRRACRARLQLLGPPQQVSDGTGPCLWFRPALGDSGRRRASGLNHGDERWFGRGR